MPHIRVEKVQAEVVPNVVSGHFLDDLRVSRYPRSRLPGLDAHGRASLVATCAPETINVLGSRRNA